MKAIVFTRPDGGVSVCRPAEGARLAFAVTIDGATISSETPRPVDGFLRRWPVDGAVVQWAETEDEFVERIKLKDTPANAVDVRIIDAATIPADRSMRAAWRLGPSGIEIDTTKAAAIEAKAARASLDINERIAAKGDAKIMALVNAAPEQLVAFARNKFPSLTLAERDEIAAILYALAVAVRPQVR
jgi:hypothetical protein